MSTVLLYVLGVLVFLLGIGVSIGLHELGHLVPARLFGVKITQYFVGFGPTVWSTKRGETEYGVKWLPLGGYVKLVGMLPPQPLDERRKVGTGRFAQLISDARAAESDLIEPGDTDRLFYRKPWWQKLIVMSGGPTVNIAIAFFLFWGIFAFHGVEVLRPTVDKVNACTSLTCADATGASPAQQAGLRRGDQVVAFNGSKVTSWQTLVADIRRSPGEQVTLGVLRDGARVDVPLTVGTLPAAAGKVAAGTGFAGLTPTIDNVTHGPIYTARQMGSYIGTTVGALIDFPVKVYGVAKTALGLTPRDPESPMSVVGAGRIAGETASAQQASFGSRVAYLAGLLAGVNLFLGMFNFVPLLPLDGGHMAGAIFEAVRRGVAKLRHRPDPGHVDIARLLPVAYVVAGAFLVMSVILMYADLVAPIKA